jgi:tRNA pseudouridine55 synthase
MSKLIRTKQGEFKLEDCYTLEDIESGNYKLLSNEEILTNLETIDIDDELLIPVNNGAVINKIFNNDIACLRHDKKIIAIYKTYEKDSSKAKPYIMFGK